MNTQEKQMILELADRVNTTSLENKDPEADRLIQTHIGTKKNALYIMTQALLIQQQALSGLQERVRQLETQIQNPEHQRKKGFFSGLFGSGNNGYSRGQANSGYNPQPNNGFSAGGPSGYGYGGQGPSPYNRGGSSFLGSAMSTAVGVAGGMALFNGLEHLFSGGTHAAASAATEAISGTSAESFLGGDFQGQDGLLTEGFGESNEMSDLSSDFDSSGMDNSSMGFGDFGDGGDFGGDW